MFVNRFVSVFLKVDHSYSVCAHVLYSVLILFDKMLKSSLSEQTGRSVCGVYFGIGFLRRNLCQ